MTQICLIRMDLLHEVDHYVRCKKMYGSHVCHHILYLKSLHIDLLIKKNLHITVIKLEITKS